MKRCVLIVTFLFLALTIVGCGSAYTYFTIHNGRKTPCSDPTSNIPSNIPGCSGPYYAVSENNGVTYYCQSKECFTPVPITPPPQCTSKYVYDNLVNEGQSWEVVSQQQDQNNATTPAQVTFTSTTSKTVTVTDKLDVIANLNANVAGDAGILIGVITLNVKAEIDHEVTQAVNATIGNTYTVSIPPGETAYANYGVRVQITSGHLYDKAGCEGKKPDWGTDVTYTPIATGWCVWLSDQPPCPSI